MAKDAVKETVKVRVYATDGSRPEDKAVSTLEELQALVGGYVELVYFRNSYDKVFVVNEEGRLHNLPENPYFQGLVGTVVVADRGSELLG